MTGDGRAARVGRAVGELEPALLPITDVRRVETGWGNENWSAASAAGRVMVKVGLAGASPEKWRSAARGLELAREAGVRAPELLAFADRCDLLDGRVLRVFSYIDGLAPSAVIDDPAKRPRFLAQLGDAVARLHGLEQPAFTSRIGTNDGNARWSEYLANRWLHVVDRATRAGLDRELTNSAATVLLPLSERFDDVARPVLCHRDLYLDNMLCDGDGNLVALLDFDLTEAWEPAADFHKLRWWVFGDDERAERAFASGYGGGGPGVDDFEDRVRVVEIIELVNGLANWLALGDTGLIADAHARLRRFLEA